MAVYLSSSDITALATHEVTMRAAWDAVRSEQAGTAVLPPRLDVDLPNGFLRFMPAALGDVMGAKVMTLVRGVGNRYLLLLYSQESGALTAVLDASEITRLRTAAITAVAGQLLCPAGAEHLAVIGSGFEAEGHLRAFARSWPVRTVRVFSPSVQRREGFAQRLGEELSLQIEPASSTAEALEGAPVAVIATKSQVPVVDGSAFAPGASVLSIGSTRPDLRELDRATFARASVVLVDSSEQVRRESGDVIEALSTGALGVDHLVSMSEAGNGALRSDDGVGRDLRVFKSVGTALQDLALAKEVLRAAAQAGAGRELGDLAELKLSGNPRSSSAVVEGAS